MQLIIQANYSQLSKYQNFLDDNPEIQIEITDFAYPQNYGLEGEKLLDKWLNHSLSDRVIGLHGSYYDLILHSIDPQISQISWKRYLWNLGISDKLNAGYTIFHTNFQTEHSSRNYIKNWISVHAKFISASCETYKSTIVLENLRDPSPLLLSTLAKIIDHSEYCLDIGHLQGYSVETMKNWFEQLNTTISLIHLKDIIKPGDELQLGKGNINWEQVFEYIDNYCNSPKLILELSNLDEIVKSKNFLENLGINLT